MKPFPFIVGCGRSGTTLLRAMLDSHPQMAIPPETHFLARLSEDPFDPRGAEQVLAGDARFPMWGVPVDVIDGSTTLPDALRALFAAYAAARGKSRYGDKTPRHVERLPRIAGWLPESVFVHVIRDGRDVALSYLDVPFGPNTVTAAASLWRSRVEAGRAAGGLLGSRYIEVRYEAMVADPEAFLRELCVFIDLPYDAAMLTYPDRAEDQIALTKSPESHQRVRLAPTAGLRDWRTQMSRDDQRSFERQAGGLMDELGYR